MKRTGHTDHLSSSLTDLMTSLMVIFVLLLVTKLNNQDIKIRTAVTRVLEKLQAHASNLGDAENIYPEGDVIVIVIPEALMSFQQSRAELSDKGRDYLKKHVPGWSALLCSAEVREDIDTMVVEGHADKSVFPSVDPKRSKEKNLELSQQRSMAVVAESLTVLEGSAHQSCFLELLSATGRGDAQPIDKDDPKSSKNRRVQVRIRVRPKSAETIVRQAEGNIRQ